MSVCDCICARARARRRDTGGRGQSSCALRCFTPGRFCKRPRAWRSYPCRPRTGRGVLGPRPPQPGGGGEVLCLGLCVPDCAAAPSPVFCRDLRPRLLPPGLSGAQTRPSVSTSQRQTKMFNTSVSASPVAASPSPFLFSAFTSPRLESQRGAGAPT